MLAHISVLKHLVNYVRVIVTENNNQPPSVDVWKTYHNDHFLSYMANPSSRPVTPQATASITTTSSPSSVFKKGNKRDMSLYPELKDITHYSTWKLTFDALAHKDELGNVLDEGYKPSKADEDVFNLQKQWLFAVFTKTLKDPTAKDILCQYQHNGDSQQIYAKLKSKARKSAKATLAKMRLVEFLTT